MCLEMRGGQEQGRVEWLVDGRLRDCLLNSRNEVELSAIGATGIGSMARHDRQSLDGPDACSSAPANTRILYRELQLRPTFEQGS